MASIKSIGKIFATTIKEGMLKENDLTKENLKLKEQNKILLKKEKSKREENNRNYNLLFLVNKY